MSQELGNWSVQELQAVLVTSGSETQQGVISMQDCELSLVLLDL
jgi:hypothetical protein